MSSEVPEEWTKERLGKYVKIESGNAFQSSEFSDKGIPIVRISNIRNGKIDLSNAVFCEENKRLEKFLIANGDVLLAMSGATTGKIGKYTFSFKSYLNQRVGRFNVIDETKCENEYVYQLVRSREFTENTLIDAIGGAQPNISSSQVENIVYKFPPLPEQKKIASILTSVDEVIENTQKQIDKLQDLKKATMNELLTKGIGHTEFKDSELGRIPKSWEVIKLSGLCSLHYGKSPKEIEDDDGMYPIYGTGGIVGKTNSALHAGKSIVIGRKGSIDNVSFVDSPFWAIDTTYYVEGKNVEMKWLFYRLQYEGLKKYNEASGVPSLSRDTLYSIAIQSPPASEQTQICVILDTVESQISSLDIKLHQTQSLKRSLMQDLLTGKVRVTVN